MARARGGKVSKTASETLPARRTQPRPLVGGGGSSNYDILVMTRMEI